MNYKIIILIFFFLQSYNLPSLSKYPSLHVHKGGLSYLLLPLHYKQLFIEFSQDKHYTEHSNYI